MIAKKFAHLIGLAGLALALLLPVAPAAAQSVSLAGEVKVERTVVENGAERKVLSAPEDVVPGDRLVFSTLFRNESGEVVENFVVTNPLPSAVMLAEYDPAFVVSVDGGATFAPLPALTVADPQGATRPAELSDVTHLRWTLERLQPGQSGSLSYHAFVR